MKDEKVTNTESIWEDDPVRNDLCHQMSYHYQALVGCPSEEKLPIQHPGTASEPQILGTCPVAL